MFRSAAFALCALAGFYVAPASAETTAAQCQDMSFRVYFSQGSDDLSPAALETIQAAARDMAGCTYAELHVSVDAASPHAAQRGQAILAAMNGRTWNVMQVEPVMSRQVSYGAAPAFAEVTMSSTPLTSRTPLAAPNAGV